MTVSQIAGAVRLRRHQVGIQSALQTAVAATRRVPYRGAIVINPNRTEPDVDVGSLDPVLPPYPTALDATSTWTGVLCANDAQIFGLAGVVGGVTPSTVGTTGKQWDFQAASLTSDVWDVFTDQWGDDTEATDGIIAFGGVLDSEEYTYPEDLGPVTINHNWVYAGATPGSDLTNALVVESSPTYLFAADTIWHLDTTAATIGATSLSNDIHSGIVRINNNLDRKRFQSGSNTRFQLGGYGRGARVIEYVVVRAKTASAIAERATIDDDPVPSRYIDVDTASTVAAGTSVPYRLRHRSPVRLFEVADVEVGGNAAIQFTYRAFYDSTLTYAYHRRVVNQSATAVPAGA